MSGIPTSRLMRPVDTDSLHETLTQVACPHCATASPEREIAHSGYRCPSCGLELAHLDTTPAGLIRGVLGWLHRPGDLILDRYGVTQVLGKGGFAAAYLVEDLRLNNKRRAIKELPEGLYDETETDMLSRLSHPSIPDIIDRVHQDGMVYLVMEFGGSRTLETERQRWGGRIPYATLVPWIQQLVGVLSYLHHQTPPIIHRDLKPENVLLDEQDRVMLIDFGIAKQSADGGQTRTLARAATHGFSPPEQALGTGTDPRSDVYALAATVYALLTGQVPPPAHQRVAGTELTLPTAYVPGLPSPFVAALLQALNLNINLRPASVDDFLRDAGLGAEAPMARVTDAPLAVKPAAPRTLLVTETTRDLTDQAASVRIGSERLTLAPAHAGSRRSRTPLWIGAGLISVLITGLGVWWTRDGGKAPESKDPLTAPAAQSSNPTPVPATLVAEPPSVVTAPGLAPEPATAAAPNATVPAVDPATPAEATPAAPSATVPTVDSAAPAEPAPAQALTGTPVTPPAGVQGSRASEGAEPVAAKTGSSAMDALEKSLEGKSPAAVAAATAASPDAPSAMPSPAPQEPPKRSRPPRPPSGTAAVWGPGVHLGTRKTD